MKKFVTLDAIRGIAAISVLIWHSESLFGWRPASGYLAVDLFFILSGFVLANAYDSRLSQGLTPWSFMVKRVIRIYPLYMAGLSIAIFWPLLSFALQAKSIWTPTSLGVSIGLGSVLLPSPSPTGAIYPLNSPAWSLLSELLVNVVFAYCFFWLTNSRLLWLSILSFLTLIVATHSYGDLNIGWHWDNWLGAFPRVFYAFPVGVLLSRFYRNNGWRLNLGPALPIGIVAIALAFEPSSREVYDLAIVLLVFPLAVLSGASSEPAKGARLFAFLGGTSYAVYCLHIPLYGLYSSGVPAVLGVKLAAPVSGLVFLAVVLLVSWIGEEWHKSISAKLSAAPLPSIPFHRT